MRRKGVPHALDLDVPPAKPRIMGKNGKPSKSQKNAGGKLSQWAKIKIVCKVVRGKLQKAYTMGYLTVPGQEQAGRALTRLSSSCPSLNVEGEEIDDEDFLTSCKSGRSSAGAISPTRRSSGRSLRSEDGGDNTPSPTTPLTSGSLDDQHLCPDTPKIRVNDSTPTGSEEFLLDARKPFSLTSDAHRRSSWSGLSDEEKKRARQRSVSLSSLDSDTEEPFYENEDSTHTQGSDSLDGNSQRAIEKHRSLSGSSSPVTYGARTTGGSSSTFSLNEEHLDKKSVKSNASEKPRLLAPRLTLQKSISTPSILAGVNQQAQTQKNKTTYPYDDENTTSKRRKRGSIFFRKKKDKSKKSSHQFVGVCYGNATACDVCNKPMTNKPALRCETCCVCVHENTCKDQISDCSKLKNTKMHKPSLGPVLGSTTKSSSLGSTPGSNNGSSSRPGSAAKSRPSSYASSPTRPHSIAVTGKMGGDEKDGESLPEHPDGNILETNSASMESLEDASEHAESSLCSIDSDPELRLLEKEPELWVNTVDKELVSSLDEKEVKKQEHIYELIITEKHHCRMLKVMKELFAEGMLKELGMKETQVKSIFPCLEELITIHFSFLWRLRERQRASKHIETIGDLLLQQFVGDNAQGLKEAYGIFCAGHQDAVSNYKELMKTDRRFQTFIRSRSSHHLMKKKGVPEGILFLTHRVTKYPLMIEALLKYSKNQPEEMEMLKKSLECVKEILVNVNAQVAEKEKRQRLLDIYHKLDAKSSTMYKDQKFKKSDILTGGRKLMFEGQAVLTQQRGKQLTVIVVVMSDLIFFLLENNQKYYFVSPDNKAGAIPLSKLLVREKAGQDSKGIYLISGNQAEMFELGCVHPKDKKVWLDSIRDAVDHCPDDDSDSRFSKLSAANSENVHELLMLMQQQDKEICRLCEEKMKNFLEISAALGNDSLIHPPHYRAFLDESNLDPQAAKDLQMHSITESLRLVTGASGWGTNLARSVSSVGEHQSEAYVSPSLPKRAETFGGFDNPIKDNTLHPSKQAGAKKKKDSKTSLLSEGNNESNEDLKNRRPSGSSPTIRSSQDNLSLASIISDPSSATLQQQQALAAQLVQHLNTALILSHHHLTQHEMLRVKMLSGANIEGKFSHSQKLEELRNIQEQISHERAQWARERDHQERWITDKTEDMKRLQDSLRTQQEDISQQREDLYRKLEALKSQGIVLNPTLTVLTSSQPHQFHDWASSSSEASSYPTPSPHTSPTGTIPGYRPMPDPKHRHSTSSLIGLKRDSNPSLPTHLISNSTQVGKPPHMKQQLPMKLAKLGGAGSSSGSSTGSISSSMSSSLSSSFGGSNSPSQDKGDLGKMVQQVLPLKLSEGSLDNRTRSGYQILQSPQTIAESSLSHQRNVVSPLYNGSPTAASSVQSKESVEATDQYRIMADGKLRAKKSRIKPTESSAPSSADTSRTRPGHRMKDPETDQDIIFF